MLTCPNPNPTEMHADMSTACTIKPEHACARTEAVNIHIHRAKCTVESKRLKAYNFPQHHPKAEHVHLQGMHGLLGAYMKVIK